MKYSKRLWMALGYALAVVLLFTSFTPAGRAAAQDAPEAPEAAVSPYEWLNVDVQLPDGAKVAYLRVFYYDTVAGGDSWAYLSRYDGAYGLLDQNGVSSSGSSGYGTDLSSSTDYVIDNYNYAYMLNWRAGYKGDRMQLCGLRIAYYKFISPGVWETAFTYYFVAGSALHPRSFYQPWKSDGSGGCTFVPYQIFLPSVSK